MLIKNKEVQVLLSSYNGEKYIHEQLDSLESQRLTNIDLTVLIRDDGSKDATSSILKQYSDQYPQLYHYIEGDNLGAKGSFFKLIQMANPNKDYYAFCDQDDIWAKDKLQRAIQCLESEGDLDRPLMYCSSTQMVDSNLVPLQVWPKAPRLPISIHNALVENIAVGCTMVINRAAMNLMKEHQPNNLDHVIMHDWWVYLVISAFGKVLFDSEPHILYRQHQENVQGGQANSGLKFWVQRTNKMINGKVINNKFSRQAIEFLNCYKGLLQEDQESLVIEFIEGINKGIVHRIRFVKKSPIYRHSIIDNYLLKAMYLLKRV
ncbi:glycosyltransferase family 2 protein [Paenibacillus sp. CAA11]|uniref:glycosyltransferase family 2 protein n=1 Tax=Paenibacillus sp. CAA11 TaxID=1532905 RepID=UPI00131F3803|nr:glycosyltransferase family 2 protein [Paenibacillus sp. CAA11]